ncbi:MAG TPA: DUF3224 domain-containing protein, partial [Polyangiaceae bacterium]
QAALNPSLLAATMGVLAWSACTAAHQPGAARGLEARAPEHCRDAGSNHSSGATVMPEKTRFHAAGRTEVKTYVPVPFDEVADGPSLVEVQLTETFSGDIEGESTVRVIQAAHKDGSMSFVGLQRVRGSVGGRKGSFLLQPAGTVVGEETKADWFVVSGSGTDDLKGLRGEGGFKAQLGEHGSFWLDYYFE